MLQIPDVVAVCVDFALQAVDLHLICVSALHDITAQLVVLLEVLLREFASLSLRGSPEVVLPLLLSFLHQVEILLHFLDLLRFEVTLLPKVGEHGVVLLALAVQ